VYGLGRRVLGGAAASTMDLLGYGEEADALEAVDPEAGIVRSTAEEIAGGVGFVGGLTAASGTGFVAGSVIPGIGNTLGAGVGAGIYMGAAAVDAIKKRYQGTVEETGDTGSATAAAITEGGVQGAMALIGGKKLAEVGQKIVGRTFGKIGAELTHGAVTGAVIGVIGGSGSTFSEQVGTGNYNIIDIVKGGAHGAGVGAATGAVASGTGVVAGKFLSKPPDVHQTDLNRLPETTVNSDKAVETETGQVIVPIGEGKIVQHNKESGETSVPYDAAFPVSTEFAEKIDKLKASVDPQGEPVKIYLNSDGKPVVNNPYLGSDLELHDTKQGLGEIEIPTEGGDRLLELNAPRAGEGQEAVYASRVSGKSTGAMFAGDYGKEREAARKVRMDPELSENMRADFGEIDGPGLQRYHPGTNQ